MFNLTNAPIIISRLITLLIAFTIHEFSHAWTADRFGDSTPRSNGRLTLNPIAHLDLMGSLMLIFAGFGWAKPVPVNLYALQRASPSAPMWVSLAGPGSNFLMAILAAVPIRAGLVSPYDYTGGMLPTPGLFLYQFIFTNLALMLFNLIPLAPLDGEKIADYFFPPSWARFLDQIRPYGPLILLAIIFLPGFFGIDIIGAVMGPPLNALTRLLLGANL